MAEQKTTVAVRPGWLSQAEAAFAGLEIEVDPTLTKDYEFRKRDKTFAEVLEEQADEAEQQAADPKNATTVVINLIEMAIDEIETDELVNKPFIVIRCSNDISGWRIANILQGKVKHDDDPKILRGRIRDLLEDNDVRVYSISIADGIITPDWA